MWSGGIEYVNKLLFKKQLQLWTLFILQLWTLFILYFQYTYKYCSVFEYVNKLISFKTANISAVVDFYSYLIFPLCPGFR